MEALCGVCWRSLGGKEGWVESCQGPADAPGARGVRNER